jgi:hypothetical protein
MRPALTLAGGLLTIAGATGLMRGPDGAPGALVAVEVSRGAGAPEVATGFARDGRVITVAHVLSAGGAIAVRGNATPRRASIVRVDAAADLAVLAAPGLRGDPVPPVAGVRVLVRRGGRPVAVPVRVVRRIRATIDGRTRAALELRGDVEAGDSGAPVVAPGRLLGVVFARSTRRPGTAYAVAVSGP